MNHRVLSVIACACMACSVHAQGLFEKFARYLTEPQQYVCFKPCDNIKIDGKFTEASWQKALSTVEFSDISGTGFAKPKYKTTAKMLWDDKYLYIGAVLEEPDIEATLKNHDDIIYHDNDFEVFINPAGNGIDYFELETNALGTLFDLILDKPYRSDGNYLTQWDCKGIKVAINRVGTLNKPGDVDKGWSVEMAIPHDALRFREQTALQCSHCWRINFSRVEWLKKKGPEENWVWSPTGRIDMHMPERWAYLHLIDATVGSEAPALHAPYNMAVYKLLWAMFYAQQDSYARTHQYLHSLSSFALTSTELEGLPKGAVISVDATETLFEMSITDPEHQWTYRLTSDGHFSIEAIKEGVVVGLINPLD